MTTSLAGWGVMNHLLGCDILDQPCRSHRVYFDLTFVIEQDLDACAIAVLMGVIDSVDVGTPEDAPCAIRARRLGDIHGQWAVVQRRAFDHVDLGVNAAGAYTFLGTLQATAMGRTLG